MSETTENKTNAEAADRLDGVVIRIQGWVGKTEYETLQDEMKRRWQIAGDRTIAPTMYRTRGNKADWPEFEWPPRKITITVTDA